MLNDARHIILNSKPLVWKLSFTYDDIFNIVSTETAYSQHRSAMKTDDADIITDDDRPLFNYYLSIAISDLTGLLAKRLGFSSKATAADGFMPAIEEGKGSVAYNLVMDDNHEQHLLPSLYRHCTDFLVKRVLEQWYKTDGLSGKPKADVIRILEFRKIPVRRPIRNML